jgi:hypothetical protein
LEIKAWEIQEEDLMVDAVLEEMVEGDLDNLGVEVRIGLVADAVLEEMVEGDLDNLKVGVLIDQVVDEVLEEMVEGDLGVILEVVAGMGIKLNVSLKTNFSL